MIMRQIQWKVYTYLPYFLCHFLAFLFRFSVQTLSLFAH